MLPKTIEASIHKDAITKVTSFFNATLGDMVREVFQNARRSGAKNIEVTTTDDSIEIHDDGHGIENPAALLAFGQSAWDGREHESPAGMGLYSLASTTSVITSRTAEMTAGWQVRLEAKHYRGESPAEITAAPSGTPVGTTVRILTKQDKREPVSTAGRYLPVRVTRDGARIQQEPFDTRTRTAGAVKTKDLSILVREKRAVNEWEGFHRDANHAATSLWSTINFHGHVVSDKTLRLPAAEGLDRSWYVEIDVHRCPELQLVLPARKETVHNPFLDVLRRRAEHAIFETIEAMKRPPALPYRTWRRGAEVLGHELPKAPVRLRRWSPSTGENYRDRVYGFDESLRETVRPDGLIVPERTDGPKQVLLEHAATRCNGAAGLTLYEEDKRYEGFAQYDELRRVQDVRVLTRTNGAWSCVSGTGAPILDQLVEEIELTIETSDKTRNHLATVDVRSDVGFCNTSSGYQPDQIGIVLVKDHIDKLDVAAMVMTGFYLEDEGADESDSTQRDEFEEAIQNQLAGLLLTSRENAKRRIRNALDDKVASLLPKGETITIRYTPNEACEIEGLEI